MKHQISADKDLLEQALTLWELGDWESLIKFSPDLLRQAPAQALLALLIAAAHLQLGDQDAARQKLMWTQQAGCSPMLIRKVLVAGVHNTLGRAAAINGQLRQALHHFTHAIEVAALGGDVYLGSLARARAQLSQLSISISDAQLIDSLAECDASQTRRENPEAKPSLEQRGRVAVEQLSAFNLGEAWASNTVNTVIFRHHGVLTWGEFQYAAFYVNETALRVVQRHLSTDDIKTHDIAGQYNLRDAHNSISLGVDRDGYIHISYDHHATKLRYRRSGRPHTIESWTDELPMTGVNEDRVTYPTFILPRAGYPLTLLYRDGVHNKGSARLKIYSESAQEWTDRPTPILSGADQKPWSSNAYWNHPAIGTDGSLHLSFVWRTEAVGEQQLVNNLNIDYAWSPDNGLHWFTSSGQPYKLPITQVNAETLWPVSPGSNLINQTSMALDSLNRPHIAFYSNDANGIPQYQHLSFDGKTWHHQYVCSRDTPFRLQGGGTLQIPISRPEIIIDRHDTAYAIYRGDLTENRMSVTRLNPTEDQHASRPQASTPLWSEPLGFAEPIVDRTRWPRDQVLTLLLQENHQPDGDRAHEQFSAPVWLVDYRIR